MLAWSDQAVLHPRFLRPSEGEGSRTSTGPDEGTGREARIGAACKLRTLVSTFLASERSHDEAPTLLLENLRVRRQLAPTSVS